MADKQFDYAVDSVKQVLTLSTAVLAVSLTFSKDWAKDAGNTDLCFLKASWMAFLVSIVCGIWAMLATSGIAFAGVTNIKDGRLRLPWFLQLVFFSAGLICLVVFAWRVLD